MTAHAISATVRQYAMGAPYPSGINEPFYGERYVFSINDKAERIYEKLLRDYQRGVQLCVTSCALKFMERFGLTAEEYVELVNNIVA